MSFRSIFLCLCLLSAFVLQACSIQFRESITFKKDGSGTARLECVVRSLPKDKMGGNSMMDMMGAMKKGKDRDTTANLTEDPTLGSTVFDTTVVVEQPELENNEVSDEPIDTTIGMREVPNDEEDLNVDPTNADRVKPKKGDEEALEEPSASGSTEESSTTGPLGSGQKMDTKLIMAKLKSIPGISSVKSDYLQREKAREAAKKKDEKKNKGKEFNMESMMSNLNMNDSTYFSFKFANVGAYNAALRAFFNLPDSISPLSADIARGYVRHLSFPFVPVKKPKTEKEKKDTEVFSNPMFKTMFGEVPIYRLRITLPREVAGVSLANAKLGKKGYEVTFEQYFADIAALAQNEKPTLPVLEIQLK
jgi:hypothetical protein